MAGAAAEEFQPMADINTTPLIDLMLVLLIMFIVTVPVASHKVPVDLPVPRPDPVVVQTHRLDIDAGGGLYWDGRPIADHELTARLAALAADPAEPALHMNADAETRYERFDQILAAVRRAGIVRLGFVGTDRFAEALAGR